MNGVALWQPLLALLPFAVLIVGFTVFKMGALGLSFYVWILELIISAIGFKLGIVKLGTSSLWGIIAMWTAFLILYSGQIFGQAFRSTGLLRVLLDALGNLLPTKEGQAVTLSSVVGGVLGAFNGFATYPVTIPGLVELGATGVRAAAGYMVYFSWSIAFVSMSIAATLGSQATGLEISAITRVMGILSIPGVLISTFAFFRIMGYSLKKRSNWLLIGIVTVSNWAAILIFTQWLSNFYLLMLIGGAIFTVLLLLLFKKPLSAGINKGEEKVATVKAGAVLKAVAPLASGVVLVLLWKIPAIAKIVGKAQFSVAWFGHTPVNINIISSPAFYIFVTAALCYAFSMKRGNTPWADIKAASKRSVDSLVTLLFGSAMVYLMVDSGQISILAKTLSSWGADVYAVLMSGFTFLAGMAFGQGMPADLMLSGMQIHAAAQLGVPLIVLVALAALMTMGPANPLKPSLLRYTSSLANIKGQDGTIFRITLGWQVLQLVVIAIVEVILIHVL